MTITLGLDVGGANIKAATSAGETCSVSFLLWRQRHELADQLRAIIARWPDVGRIALTMTGELADCYETKSAGVSDIIAATRLAAADRSVRVWTTEGEFVSSSAACSASGVVAAANWHSLATWLARQHPEESRLLLDIGSTTTDIIPMHRGRVAAQGRSDPERLLTGELVYTGVRRTPLCAVVEAVPFRGGQLPVAAELFATMHDVYLWRGDVPEDPADCDTANGRPATREHARDRLCRMLCCDREEVSLEELTRLTNFWADAQLSRIVQALGRVSSRFPGGCDAVIVSGSGEFLADRALATAPDFRASRRVSLTETWGPGIAEAACAFAIAKLLAEA